MKIQRKYYPYVFIFALALMGSSGVYFLLPGLPWYLYIAGFFARFLFISIIWQLISAINKRIEKRFTIEKQPGIHIALQVIITFILLSPVFLLSYFLAKPYLPIVFEAERLQILFVVISVLLIIMLTFGYYSFDLFVKYRISIEEKTRLRLEAMQLEKEKSMMRYHHLKNQVNPHFLFNTLTSLDGLIQSEPVLASDFVRHLSNVYRYVLEHKENEVVSLETETAFIRHYISLLEIRYKRAVDIRVDISDAGLEKGIVMVTLQMLIDNAIKHNIVQEDQPLHICIRDEDDYLHVQNDKQLRRQLETSNNQGLAQLRELYAYLDDRPVEIIDKETSFEVLLPLL